MRTFSVLLMLCLIFTNCNKKSSGTSQTTVEYQVTATNSSNIDINYNNVLQQKVTVNAVNTWTFDVIIDKKPFTAYVQGSSNSPFSSVETTCTVNILVNGSVVKTNTASSNTVAVAEASYIVQ